ncbi:hypothetical protein [Oceanobacillus sp. J11TS1]|nr:hypothetical protein [Oceanobacillus sp. J11TS1]GIO25108.1 hypothetical protein J11TS1_36890 [Oceanobacillus sp. J11TS1]
MMNERKLQFLADKGNPEKVIPISSLNKIPKHNLNRYLGKVKNERRTTP